MSKEGIGETTILQDKEILIMQTASLLREDITDCMNSLKDMPWPPMNEFLTSNDQKMPHGLKLFMGKLLTSPGNDSEILILLVQLLMDLAIMTLFSKQTYAPQSLWPV